MDLNGKENLAQLYSEFNRALLNGSAAIKITAKPVHTTINKG